MKVSLKIIKASPNNIESIEMEDVASYEVTDKEITVKFNSSTDEKFPLMNNQEGTLGEWFGLETFCTRIGLKIDMSK